jgi:predicted RNase H-like nuclease (RuvC/YqgF family)
MTFTDAGPDFDPNAKDKDGAIPRFFVDKRHNVARSEKEGRPCYDDVEYVEILVPGDRLNQVTRIVTQKEKDRWPGAYKRFRDGQEGTVDGTPIEQLPGMTAAQAAELKHFHIVTIEQLAEMPDGLLLKARPMDGRALRDRAKRWVDTTAGAASEERLAAEIRARDEKITNMEKAYADQQAIIDRLTARMNALMAGAPAPQT